MPSAPARGLWGPLLFAFAAEAVILAGILLWFTTHVSSPAVSSLGPVQLDLTMPPTPEPAPSAPQVTAPSSEEETPKPAAVEPPQAEAPAEDAKPTAPAPPQPESPAKTEQAPPPSSADSTAEASTTPAESRAPEHRATEAPSHAPSLPQSMAALEPPLPLPDLSLLPRDAAHSGPRQAAPKSANGQVDKISVFYEQLNAALNSAAAHFPEAVRNLKTSGHVQIAVHYRDGNAWGARIVQSSGSAAFDQAVLDGLAHTVWPPPPEGLEGREIIVPIRGSFW